MSVNPYESSESIGKVVASKPARRRVVVVALLVLVVLPVFVSLCILPNFRMAREAARRSECASHLKQIGFALHNYYDAHGTLPPAYIVDADGKPLHSWRTLLLPYLGQQALYETIDFGKPWDDPANRAAFETDVPCYRCPSANALKGQATYVAVLAPDGCFRGSNPTSFADITDDADLTLLVIEVDAAHAVHWMSPHDADEAILAAAAASKMPSHTNVMYATLADGSERGLRRDLPAATLRALISIAAGG